MTNKGRNSNLHGAKRAKNDEFFTRLQDIEAEVAHYVQGSGRNKRNPFKGAVVYLNCDDPFESNFFKYFAMKFKPLGLKGLIATTYVGSYLTGKGLALEEIAGLRPALEAGQEVRAYGVELTEVRDVTGDGEVGWDDIEQMLRTDPSVVFPLEGDGGFRSEECVELLRHSDVVVTNPPFSLFREYVAQLIEHDKKFLILGNINAVTYKEIFPLIKDGKIWPGMAFNKAFTFAVPDSYFSKTGERDAEGHQIVKVPAIAWFTNLDHRKRHEEFDLIRYYEGNEDAYPKYDNYDAIEVSRTKDIPADYEGVMGVPITFLDKHNPEQFEILGLTIGSLFDGNPLGEDWMRLYRSQGGTGHFSAGMIGIVYRDSTGKARLPYGRLLIRNLNPQKKIEF